MARILVTGAADGLGLAAAQKLVKQGHQVVLHARSKERAEEAMAACPGAETCLAADLSDLAETKDLAGQANSLGPFDAVIHNAGVGPRRVARGNTNEGLPLTFATNSIAPYVLTCMMAPPKRLVYMSSSLHSSGDPSLKDLKWDERKADGYQMYNDSKLHLVLLSNFVARQWLGKTLVNSVDPGWINTKMGTSSAPGNVDEGSETQVWLATSEDEETQTTGKYWYRKKERTPMKASMDEDLQETFISRVEEISGVKFPREI